MSETSIEWTDVTWNPVRGCSRVSEGCRSCYAERVAVRFSGPGQRFEGFADRPTDRTDAIIAKELGEPLRRAKWGWTGKVALVESKLREPLSWRKPRRVFVNSMSDLFHEALPDEAIDRVFAVMALSPRHTFQVLTKRPERMREYVTAARFREINAAARAIRGVEIGAVLPTQRDGMVSGVWPLSNVWLGVSVEDQKTADERIPLLLDTPAAVRFVSAEPLLEAVDLALSVGRCLYCKSRLFGSVPPHAVCAARGCVARGERSVNVSYKRPDWIIVGGESGPNARPCDVDWIRSIVEQCASADVACFVKQLGAVSVWNGCGLVANNPPGGSHGVVLGNREMRQLNLFSKKGGEPSEWPADLRVRQFPREREAVRS